MQFEADRITPQPYLPSFSQVLSQGKPSLRLPCYKVSYRLRYHPYPRYAPRPIINDDFLTTLGHGHIAENADQLTVSTFALDNEDTDVAHPHDALPDREEKNTTQDQSRSPIIVLHDLALTVRRVLHALRLTIGMSTEGPVDDNKDLPVKGHDH